MGQNGVPVREGEGSERRTKFDRKVRYRDPFRTPLRAPNEKEKAQNGMRNGAAHRPQKDLLRSPYEKESGAHGDPKMVEKCVLASIFGPFRTRTKEAGTQLHMSRLKPRTFPRKSSNALQWDGRTSRLAILILSLILSLMLSLILSLILS